MNIEEADLRTPGRNGGDRLGHVHIGGNHRGHLGAGHLDHPMFSVALAEIDDRGTLTFESFSSAVVSPTRSDDLAIWRNLWDDGFDLAVRAHEDRAAGLTAGRAASQ